MGLQYNVQILCNDSVTGFSDGILREHYPKLALITGYSLEKLAQNCWSQLVDTRMAGEFLRQVGNREHYKDFMARYEGELCRITIA